VNRFISTVVLSLVLLTCPGIAQPPQIGSCSVLPANNIWNTTVDQLPVSPNSSTYITTIGATSPVHGDFGSGTYNGGPIGIPFITVPGTQTKYPVTFQYADESDPGPYAVPLNTPIEGGSQSTGDRHAISIDVNNCILYELYAAYPQASSWQAGSGAIFNLLSNNLRVATWTSADAAGLPIFPGLMRYDEIVTGEIRHAIRFTVPKTQRAYVWPARHYASSLTDPKYPPMGVRFRLRANYDISGFSVTNQTILRALKKYGMMIADNGSAWFISGAPDSGWDNSDLHNLANVKGSDFEVVDVSSLMVNPDSGQALQIGVSVSVSPSSSSVPVNTTKQFSATVQNSADQSVTWSVNGMVGGSSVTGWIDSVTGLYTAPSTVPSPANVTLQAASHAMPSAVGSATATVTPAPPPPPPVTVTISPASATVRASRTKQFTATVQNSSNHSVTWKVSGVTGGNGIVGTIGATGLYKAPVSVPSSSSTFTVTAVSVASPSASANASVTVLRR
jgi:LysM repeat protein